MGCLCWTWKQHSLPGYIADSREAEGHGRTVMRSRWSLLGHTGHRPATGSDSQ